VPAAEVISTVRRYLSFETLFALLVVATAFTRFFRLNLKLYHHDEAIHAWFSYDLLTKGSYSYDPMYHGPVLYYITAGMFRIFGDSDLVGRLVPALLGVLIVVLVYFVYHLGYLDQRQSLLAGLLIMLSPNMVYFSRFLRHDIFMLFFTFLLIVAVLYYVERKQLRFAALAGLAAGLALSCKEEMPLILIILGAYFVYVVARRTVTLPPNKQLLRDLAVAVLLCAGVMAVLYSFFGLQIETLWTGPVEAIEHWLAMHNQQRLGGPPYFYVLLFGLYEVPIVILAGASVISYAVVRLWRGRREDRLAAASAEIDALAGVAPSAPRLPAVDRRDEFFKLCLVWMAGTMVMYGYIGEKVPWLIIQQLLPMCLAATWWAREKPASERLVPWNGWKWVTVAFLLFSIFVPIYGFGMAYTTHHVQFVREDISEPIVQVQNSEDLRGVFAEMNRADLVVVASPNYWPLPWYYRGDRWDRIQFYGNRIDESSILSQNPDMVIAEAGAYASLAGFEKRTIKLNYWYSHYDNQNRIPEYYFARDGNLGSMNLDIFTRIG
jgi:uncharacterized protein (TIGR03663 family)